MLFRTEWISGDTVKISFSHWPKLQTGIQGFFVGATANFRLDATVNVPASSNCSDSWRPNQLANEQKEFTLLSFLFIFLQWRCNFPPFNDATCARFEGEAASCNLGSCMLLLFCFTVSGMLLMRLHTARCLPLSVAQKPLVWLQCKPYQMPIVPVHKNPRSLANSDGKRVQNPISSPH